MADRTTEWHQSNTIYPMETIYLDNNATTPPAPEVLEAMDRAWAEAWANPSSVHRLGQAARYHLELARRQVAGLVGCRESELVFTSGGTESNNTALMGVLARPSPKPRYLVTTPIEHSAIREPAEALEDFGVEIVQIPVDTTQTIEPGALEETLRTHVPAGATVLVSVQWANNETGAIQPVEQLREVVRQFATGALRGDGQRSRAVFHTDATQAVGKVPVDAGAAGVDLMSFSSHKFHGPKGVGGLYMRSGLRMAPWQRGGPQERDRRGGTENVVGIVGAGVAAERAAERIADPERLASWAAMRDRFEQRMLEHITDAVVHLPSGPRLWNTTNIGFPRLEAEAILLTLSERGVCASAGAACSSGSLDPSPVLLAMGIDRAVAHGSLRFSSSHLTTAEELDRAAEIITEVVARIRGTMAEPA